MLKKLSHSPKHEGYIKTLSKNGAIESALHLINYFKVPVSKSTVLEQLNIEANLYDLNNAFKSWNIPSLAVKIGLNDLIKVQPPFIAHCVDKGGHFVVVVSVSDLAVEYVDITQSRISVSREEFENIFSGNILLIEPNESSGEFDYVDRVRSEKIKLLKLPLLIIGSTILLLINILFGIIDPFNISWLTVCVYALKSAGLLICVILLAKTYGNNSSSLNQFCMIGQSNCEKIISSKGATLFLGIGWADIGFIYFSGGLATLLFSPTLGVFLILSALSTLSLPFTLYSIYYQLTKNAFCFLCTSVILILWLEIITAIEMYSNYQAFFKVSDVIILITSYGLIFIIGVIIKPFLIKSYSYEKVKKKLDEFINDEELFDSKLKQNKINNIANRNCILLGDEKSTNSITLILSPYCSSCQTTYQTFSKRLLYNRNICFRIIIVSQEPFDEIIYSLMALREYEDARHKVEALNDWFITQLSVKEWLKKYSISVNQKTNNIVNENQYWIQSQGIESTPTILFNEFRVPRPYELNDIWKFLSIRFQD